MKIDVYRNLILRAAAEPDGELFNAIALHLADTERAKRALINKGYGEANTSMTDMVGKVPENFVGNTWSHQ